MDRPIRVLHVDDEPEIVELTATFLERHNGQLELESATDPSDGLTAVGNGDFDCIVSDYDMPRMNGIEFLKRVRENDPDLPFILFTGKGSEDIASEAISAGVTDYLQKGGGTDQYAVLANRITNTVDRYQAERQRRRWKRAVETAREGIAIVGPDGTYLQMNDAYAETYGASVDDLIGREARESYPSESRAVLEDVVMPALREEGTWEGQVTARRQDGTRFEQRLSMTLLQDGGHVCVMEDITDREARKRELERYQTVVDALGDPVYKLDAAGRFTYVNDALIETFGYSREELCGEHISKIVREEDVERGEELIRSLLSAEDCRTATYEMVTFTATGDRIRTENHLALLPRGEDGEFRGTAGVIREIRTTRS